MGANAGIFREEFALTPLGKELPEQFGSLIRRYSSINFRPVMDRRLFKQPRPMRHSATLRIIRAIIEPRDPGMGYGSGAHSAGFQRHPHVASGQPVIAQKCRSLSHRDDFGVCGGVVAFERAVGSAPDDLPVFHHERTNRHFTCRRSSLGKRQRFFHHFASFGEWHLASLAGISAFGHSSG